MWPVHPRLRFRVRQRDRVWAHGPGARDPAARSDGPAAVMVKGDSNRRWRRIFLMLAAIAGAYALLAPLTSLDAAQSAGAPLLADRLWFRMATIIAMFIVMPTTWHIFGGITRYAPLGNVSSFALCSHTTSTPAATANWPFLPA